MADDPIRGPMRVAVLHDHLRFIGGGERVALTLAAAFDADLYVTDLDPALPSRAGMPSVRLHEIARVPRRAPLRQDRQARAFETADIPDHDAYVLSGNWAVFAAPRLRPNLWYCHTPVRIFYDLRDSFLSSLSRIQRPVARRWIERRRPRYERAVQDVGTIVANSRNVAGRIERFLHRKAAAVVYPPVDVSSYRFQKVGDTWLSVSRLSHEKRIDLLVEAFRRRPDERVLVVGGPQSGQSMARFVRSLRPPDNVEFLGEIEENRLRKLYANCRGLVASAQDEDFGLAPVEAMASGKAVVAVDEGGFRESVIPGRTGWLVPPTPEALAAAIGDAAQTDLEAMRSACEARARDFDTSIFVDRMRLLLAETTKIS
jgi:glycosyltransferase involved in cell wall biosynthesis